MPGNLQEYDSVTGQTGGINTNRERLVALSQVEDNAGFVRLIDHDGDPIYSTQSGALRTSADTLEFIEQVDGSAVNTNKWITSVSGMTIAQANGFITLNSGTATTANAYAILQTIQNFPFYGPQPLRLLFRALPVVQPQANMVMEVGLGAVATNAAPTDGVFFRWNGSAEFRCVISNGGVETQSAALTAPASNIGALLEITIVEDAVEFRVNDIPVADIDVPAGQAYPTNSGRLPAFMRVYNGASVPSQAPKISLGQLAIVQEDMIKGRLWDDTMVAMGFGGYQHPTTFGQTANHANSTSPVSATLSNTAAGYTTLGGKFQFAAVGAAATDYALFAFQVPAGYRFWLTNISISTAVTGLAVVTPTLLDWSLGVNSSAVSLATADGAGTWAPRRIPIGLQCFLASSAIGQMASDIGRRFDPTKAVIDSGRFVHVILQIPNGAATANLVFRGDVMINGYFE